MAMRKSRYHDRTQLMLELEQQVPQTLVAHNPNGLVEALADLLLAALGAAELPTKTGGGDEHQDHA